MEAGQSDGRTFAFPMSSAEREFPRLIVLVLIEIPRRLLCHAMAGYGAGSDIKLTASAPGGLLTWIPIITVRAYHLGSDGIVPWTANAKSWSQWSMLSTDLDFRVLTSHMGNPPD